MDDIRSSGSTSETQAPITPPPAPETIPTPVAASVAVPTSDVRPPTSVSGERRGMAAISYLGILCLIPLIFAKDSAFAQYHAKQGVILAIVGIILQLVSDVLWNVPFGGALVTIVGLVLFVVSIMGIVKAFRGEKFEIPYMSEWAAKIHF